MEKSFSESYKAAGVDVTAGYQAVELMKQPGIVGYIVKKEEQLWDIARHFHTTEAEIMETNGLKSADVQQGDKLLIVKKVSEC